MGRTPAAFGTHAQQAVGLAHLDAACLLAGLRREAPAAARGVLLGGATTGGSSGALGGSRGETDTTAELGNRGLLMLQSQVRQGGGRLCLGRSCA